jgi:transcriptional regulator with XRE-family HTH domain
MIKFCGNELKALIAKHGKGQKEVASFIGVSPSRLSSWVRGKAKPEEGYILNILKFLGYSEGEAKEVFWSLYS